MATKRTVFQIRIQEKYLDFSHFTIRLPVWTLEINRGYVLQKLQIKQQLVLYYLQRNLGQNTSTKGIEKIYFLEFQFSQGCQISTADHK